MLDCLLPQDASHRVVVRPTKPSKFGADAAVYVLLGQNEKAVVGVVGNERHLKREGAKLVLPPL